MTDNRRSAGRTPGRSRLRSRDLCLEALRTVLNKPGRAALTMLGTVLGVGAFVATVGVAQTAASQISREFDILLATEVRVQDRGSSTAGVPTFPTDTDQRLGAIPGVEAGGLLYQVRSNVTVEALEVLALDGSGSAPGGLWAASPGGLRASGATVRHGGLLDPVHDQRALRVAVLGSGLADRLGITTLDRAPAVRIDGIAFSVVGVLEQVARQPQLHSSIVVPEATVHTVLQPHFYDAAVLVEVAPGAAQQVGEQVALALRPHDPQRLEVQVPPDPRTLRMSVERETQALFLLLAAVSLVIGTLVIASTTLVAVIERIPEIGLRRALGARPRHIAGQVLAEAATLGAVGGTIGCAAGLLTVSGVAFAREWTAVLDLRIALAAPLIGTVTGLVAGLYPARRATHVQPLDALRK